MSIKRTILTDGFLLIEVIAACTILMIVIVPIAYYTWCTTLQTVQSNKHITLLLSLKDYYERDISRDIPDTQPHHAQKITRQELPPLIIDGVPLKPVCYEGKYVIGESVHTYRLISTANKCN